MSSDGTNNRVRCSVRFKRTRRGKRPEPETRWELALRDLSEQKRELGFGKCSCGTRNRGSKGRTFT